MQGYLAFGLIVRGDWDLSSRDHLLMLGLHRYSYIHMKAGALYGRVSATHVLCTRRVYIRAPLIYSFFSSSLDYAAF